MASNNSIPLGTAAGTFLVLIPNLTSEDILKTIILAVIGAIVSFTVSMVLKKFTKSKK